MKTFILGFAALGVVLVGATRVSADLITFTFQGEMTTTDTDFDAGDPFFGFFSFESTTPGVPIAEPTIDLQYDSFFPTSFSVSASE